MFGGIIALLGLPCALDLNVLNVYDKLVGAFLLIIGGLLTCVFVGYRILPEADRELAQGLDHVRSAPFVERVL